MTSVAKEEFLQKKGKKDLKYVWRKGISSNYVMRTLYKVGISRVN